MTHNPRALALEYLECVRRLDTAAMLGYFAADAQVWLSGQGWMTPAGLAALLDGARTLVVDGMQFAHEQVLECGPNVVVMTACDTPLKRGGSYINQFCFVFAFDDAGKITSLREYTDSAPAVAAFHS